MTTPYPFQVKAANQAKKWSGRCLLALEMGLGKSLTSLLWAYEHPEARPIIIVCPASLKWNWERECKVHFGMRAEILEGINPKRYTFSFTRRNIVIVNYDILYAWLDFLKALKPQLIILDECHYIANLSARRTKTVRKLCSGVPHVLALSGTPLTNRPLELWPTLNILRPELFPSLRQFCFRYCAPRRVPWGTGWDFSGASHLDELHAILTSKAMVRMRKADVLKDLPPKRIITVPVEISNRKEYDKAHKDFIQWLAEKDMAKARRAMAAERLVRMHGLKRLVGQLKRPAVEEWVDNFLMDSDGKLALFGTHVEITEGFHKRYQKQSVLVNGRVVGKDRQKAVDQFQRHDKTRLFVGNIKAAGVGLNLTAASTMAFAEFGWTPGEHTQAMDRLHRIGQTLGVDAFWLVAQGTIEEHLVKIVQDKATVLGKTLDGKGNGDSLNVYDQLEQQLLKEA